MKKATASPNAVLTADQFLRALRPLRSKAQVEKNERFYRNTSDRDNDFLGIPMGKLFAVAKKFEAMPIDEIESLLDDHHYEARMGAVCIMDFQARNKKTTDAHRKQLYELYLQKHDRINNWDMVDRSAPYVIGGYLLNKSRKILYTLAKSRNVWERRTAIVSTYFFIRQNDLVDTFKIAALLVNDSHDLIHTAAGSWIREAGKKDEKQLVAFLDKYAGIMPRAMLRCAVEKLEKKLKEKYLTKQML